MEKDFNKEVFNPDYTPGENAEDKELSIIDEQMLLLVKKQSLEDHLSRLLVERDENQKMLAHGFNDPSQFQTSPPQCTVSPIRLTIEDPQTIFENEDEDENELNSLILAGRSIQLDMPSHGCNDPSQFQTSPPLCTVSPTRLTIEDPQTLFEYATENLPDSPILTGRYGQLDMPSHGCNDPPQFQTSPPQCTVSPIRLTVEDPETLFEYATENLPDSPILTERSSRLDMTSSDSIEALTKHSDYLKNELQNLQKAVISMNQFYPNIRVKVTVSSDSHSDFENTDESAGSNICYVGKGKEAANPKFRYTKGSRNVSLNNSSGKEAETKEKSETKVPSCSSSVKDSSTKLPKESSSASESKSSHLESQESRIEVEGICLEMKRKVWDSDEKYHYRQQHLDESFGRTSGVSKLSGNLADDNGDLIIAKKMKVDVDERIKQGNLILREILSLPNQERLDLRQFTGGTSDKRELWNLPSTMSDEGGYTYDDDDSCLGNGSDDINASERGGSPFTILSDLSPGEREEESWLTSISDISSFVKGESSHASECESPSGNYFLQHIQSEDKSHKEKGDMTDDE